MEAEIVFCERCGISIPETEVTRFREASGGRDLCPNCRVPAGVDEGDLQLYFCENCRVSIAVSDVLTGKAIPEGLGYHCSPCALSTPAERDARRAAVEREMADIAAPPAPFPRTAAAPLYFCEGCNASIPAASVATGRALVDGGRTWCEGCRPRGAAAHSPGTGGGVVPVVAAALLAAAVTAAGFVVWERSDRDLRGEKAGAERDRELENLRRDVRAARAAADGARSESAERLDRAVKESDRRIEAMRAEVQAARTAAEASASRAGTVGTDRVAKIESRMGDLEEEMGIGLRSMADKIERVASRTPASVPGVPPETATAPPPPTPTEAPPKAATELSAEAKRLSELLKDKTAELRFAAAIDLGKLGEKAAWPALVESLKKDDDPFVRRACCRSLGELKAYEAFPDLIHALMDGEEYVAKQASMVIKEMAGQDFAYKQNQTKGDRRKVADRAQKWWEENKARLVP